MVLDTPAVMATAVEPDAVLAMADATEIAAADAVVLAAVVLATGDTSVLAEVMAKSVLDAGPGRVPAACWK